MPTLRIYFSKSVVLLEFPDKDYFQGKFGFLLLFYTGQKRMVKALIKKTFNTSSVLMNIFYAYNKKDSLLNQHDFLLYFKISFLKVPYNHFDHIHPSLYILFLKHPPSPPMKLSVLTDRTTPNKSQGSLIQKDP